MCRKPPERACSTLGETVSTVRPPRQPRFHVGAPPTVRKRSQTPTTEPAPFAPGAGAPTIQTPAPAPVSCRSTAHGAKAEPNPNHRARPLRTRGGCSYHPDSCASPVSCRYSVKGQAFMCSSLNNCEESKAVSSLMHAHIPVTYFLITAHWACIFFLPRYTSAS